MIPHSVALTHNNCQYMDLSPFHSLKSINMLALLFVPQGRPSVAFWLLIPVFMFDSLLNSGIIIANTGFMIKHSPQAQRTMFIAAGNAFAGMVGGLAAIFAGGCLNLSSEWTFSWQGLHIVNYHLVFAASLLLRLVSAVLARSVQEPSSPATREMVAEIFGATHLRFRRSKRKLLRRFRKTEPKQLTPG